MYKSVFILFLAFILFSCGKSSNKQLIKTNDTQALVEAIKKAQPGDEIILANGVWKDLELHFSGTGTKEKPIVLRAETEGKVSIEGQSFIKLAGEYLVISGLYFKNGYSPSNAVIEFRIKNDSIANNCLVTNCVIDEFAKPNRASQDHWVIFWGRHNSLNRCYIAGKFNQGPTVKVYLKGNEHIKNYHQIVNNHFGPRPRKGGPKAETIQIGSSFTSMTPSHTIIANNFFEKCNGEVEVISNKSNNCEILNNVFYECEGSIVLRHGNYCKVDGNYFIGNDISQFFGGIRVINTGHWISNNYFYKINGDEFRAPLAIMNGIPKSPLNRYNQVTDVVVVYNTWVDCKSPWQISVGANHSKKDVLPKSEIRSAQPVRIEVANNLIYNSKTESKLIKAYDKIDGFKFKRNIAVNQQADSLKFEGIQDKEIQFVQQEEWIYTPNADDVNELKNVYLGFGFEDIDRDILGISRSQNNSIGSMIVPLNTKNQIIDKKKYGPDWFSKAKPDTQTETHTVSTPGELIEKLASASEGDIIVLNGNFELNSSLKINKRIVLRSKGEGTKSQILYLGNEDTPAFEMNPKGHLILENIVLKGQGKQTAFATLKKNMSNIYNVIVNDSEIEGFKTVLMGFKGSMADTISFTGTKIKNCQNGLVLAAETEDKGDYNAEVVNIENCEFENVQSNVVNFYRGGYDESTIGGCLTVKNSKFINCGQLEKSKILLQTRGIINVDLSGNEFTMNPVKYIAVLWGEKNNKHQNNSVIQSGEILVEKYLKQKLVY